MRDALSSGNINLATRMGSVKSAHRRAGKVKGLDRFLGTLETASQELMETSSGTGGGEGKRPTIGFSPLDAYFSHYTIIFVNAKNGVDTSGDPADVFRYPVMLLDIRRCPHFSVNAPNFPGAFPPSLKEFFFKRF